MQLEAKLFFFTLNFIVKHQFVVNVVVVIEIKEKKNFLNLTFHLHLHHCSFFIVGDLYTAHTSSDEHATLVQETI